ncbi:MAG: BolA family protein [Methylococcaceae bacterium]
MTTIELMQERLAALHPTQIKIIDESHLHVGHAGSASGGGHYKLHIVSTQFAGLNTLARHRVIYSALGELMKHEIHALNIQALTPDQI